MNRKMEPNTPKIFRQGDNVTLMMEPDFQLQDGECLKVGLYTTTGKPLYETSYPDGYIVKVDDSHYLLELEHCTTTNFCGVVVLRMCIYNDGLSMVNSGENTMTMVFCPEPVNRNLIPKQI